MASMLIALGGAGYSATGGNFLLGRSNTATTTTRLSASVDYHTLQIGNNSLGANISALGLFVPFGRAPLYVNSPGHIARLNADLLDGIDSTAFLRGTGIVDGQAIALAPGTIAFLGSATGGFLRLTYNCPADLAVSGILTVSNTSNAVANLFVDDGALNPEYDQLAPGGFNIYAGRPAGESFSIQAQGAPGVQTVMVSTVHRPASNDCHAQALMMLAS